MKKILRIIAVTLALCMCLTCAAAPAYASDGSITASALSDEAKMKLGKIVVKAFGAVADAAITGVANLFPQLDWPKEDGYVSQNFLKGSDVIQTKAAEGAHWSAGFASESVIPADIATVGYVRAGEFHLKKELTYKVMDGDDQCFKVVALNDGSGNGTVLFCSLDAFGITSTNVRKIRAAILDAAEDAGINNIISINVTVTHVHSALDTHGLGASILDLIKDSIKAGLYRAVGKDYTVSSLDESFMNNLFAKAAKAGVDACKAMKPGVLSFNSYDISNMLYDKQYPLVYDKNVNQIKFVPDSGREIWLVNMGCHPVKMGGYDYVCSDYPEAIARWADELANADVAFFQGAQLAITRDEGSIQYDQATFDSQPDEAHQAFYVLDLYGKEIVNRMMNNTPVETFSIEPYLNIMHEEVKLSVTNSLIKIISKINMVNNIVVSNSGRLNDVKVISEVGYCEFGSKLAIAIIPGELDPAIAFGGVDGADESWNGTDWGYDPFTETVGSRKLIVYGLTNDQIGYMIPDNDFAHAFASLFESLIGGSRNKHYEEMISLGKNTASTMTVAFEKLVSDLNSKKAD